ncbi:MAG: hypothetical protein IKR41_07415 [Bacteroidales bacterium]|nr:hypothetical protein [Bacteroidales bacterium]
MKKFFLKTTILFVVFLNFPKSYAQEYNNWLLPSGVVLNFDTSPATIIRTKIKPYQVFNNYIVSLSDEQGEMILYGYIEQDENSKKLSYVIKNINNNDEIRINVNYLQNAIGCKLQQGGYCIALVYKKKVTSNGELHIYQFDQNGHLQNKYINDNANYCFFIDFVRMKNSDALIAYHNNQLETYKLTTDGCTLWQTSEIKLDLIKSNITTTFFYIEHTLDNNKIIVSVNNSIVYILNFDKNNGEVSISNSFESNMFNSMTFSNSGKFFFIIDNNKLKGFKYNNNFDFHLINPDIIYNLPKDNDIICNSCWEMAVGNDNKLYIYQHQSNYIIVLDGIESGNITKKIIESECLKFTKFPKIMRWSEKTICDAYVEFNNSVVCYDKEPLKINLSGNSPFEVFYTINGKEKSIKTSENKIELENIPGKYKITKITDSFCEFLPEKNNEAEILKKLENLKIELD